MNQKYKINIAFGEANAKITEEEGFLLKNHDCWHVKEFNTSAERAAYLRGIEDMAGWLGVHWEKTN